MIRLDDIDDHAHQGRRRKEFAAFLRAAHGELVEEVFVDAAEHIAGGSLDGGAVEDFHQIGQEVGFEGGIAPRQRAFQYRVFVFHNVHRGVDGGADIAALRPGGNVIEAGSGWQVNGGLALEFSLDQVFARGAFHAGRDAGFNAGQKGLKAVAGVAQED